MAELTEPEWAQLIAHMRQEEDKPKRNLVKDERHVEACHQRWIQRRSLPSDAEDGWSAKQCLHCLYYVELTGLFLTDWGVCSNSGSPRDRSVMFEHDGCDAFVPAETEDEAIRALYRKLNEAAA